MFLFDVLQLNLKKSVLMNLLTSCFQTKYYNSVCRSPDLFPFPITSSQAYSDQDAMLQLRVVVGGVFFLFYSN